MKTKNKISWNDIVFEFKNKEYGAYFLRKIYKKDITIAISISLLILLLLVGPPFIMAKLYKNGSNDIKNNQPIVFDPFTIKKEPPPPTPPLPEQDDDLKKQAKFNPVVVDTTEIEVEILTVDQMLDSAKIGIVENTDDNIAYVDNIDIPDTKHDVPFILPEMPSFPGGGETEMQKFIKDNFVYPQTSKKVESQGTVIVSFVVNEDGSISEIKIERGVDEDIDKEATRVIGIMPKWEPGRQNGNPAKVRLYIPIVCTLVDY